jgi:hypothetical protein
MFTAPFRMQNSTGAAFIEYDIGAFLAAQIDLQMFVAENRAGDVGDVSSYCMDHETRFLVKKRESKIKADWDVFSYVDVAPGMACRMAWRPRVPVRRRRVMGLVSFGMRNDAVLSGANAYRYICFMNRS